MAVEMNPEVETPVSTNAVKFDGGPYVAEQTADTTSTGAVEMPGPVTVTHPGFPVQEKVVTPPVKADPKTTPAKTKAVKAK